MMDTRHRDQPRLERWLKWPVIVALVVIAAWLAVHGVPDNKPPVDPMRGNAF